MTQGQDEGAKPRETVLPQSSLGPEYFREVYANNPDPWNFETSPYEAAKYDATIRALPDIHYARALEIGCSIGVLTRKLAACCEHLLSIDVSDVALANAKERCKDLPNVRFVLMRMPDEQPDGFFDLVVLSEVGYYWSVADLDRAITVLASHQRAGAKVVLVHWTPEVTDYPQTGDEVHERWLARPEYRQVHGRREQLYRLDVLERVD